MWISALTDFIILMLIAISAENAVFSRALGVSRVVKLADDAAVDILIFGSLLCVIEVISGALGFLANIWLADVSFKLYIRPLVLVLCAVIAFGIVLAASINLLKIQNLKEIVAALPMATFNSCVLGVMIITTSQSFSLVETLGFAVGSAIGYVIAVLMVTEGQRKLQNRNMPQAFRGLPATLIYIGILSLAFYAFTGHMVFV